MAFVKPEPITSAATAWNTSTTPKETATIEVKKGDVLVTHSSMEESNGADKAVVPSGGSLTWTERQRVMVNEYTELAVYTAVAAEDASFKVKFTKTSYASAHWGGEVQVWRKSGGVGVSSKTNVSSGAPTLDITPGQDHSAIAVFDSDFAAKDGSSRVARTNAGTFTETAYLLDTSRYTIYGGYHADAGTAAKYAVGWSAPGSQKYSIAAIEIKGEEEVSSGKEAPIIRRPHRGLFISGGTSL